MSGLAMSLVIRSVAGDPFSDEAVGRGGVPRGGVGPSHLHKTCHSILFAGRLAGVRGWGWAGRRLCRPPAGCVWGAPLSGRWGSEGGALSPKAPRIARTERTRSLPGGGCPGRAEEASMASLTESMRALTLWFAPVNFGNHKCRQSFMADAARALESSADFTRGCGHRQGGGAGETRRAQYPGIRDPAPLW